MSSKKDKKEPEEKKELSGADAKLIVKQLNTLMKRFTISQKTLDDHRIAEEKQKEKEKYDQSVKDFKFTKKELESVLNTAVDLEWFSNLQKNPYSYDVESYFIDEHPEKIEEASQILESARERLFKLFEPFLVVESEQNESSKKVKHSFKSDRHRVLLNWDD